MSLKSLRLISQSVVLLIFLLLLTATSTFGMRSFPVKIFLELDPLLAISSILSSATLTSGMIFSLVIVGLTLIFGRVFCGWICPLGTLHHLVGHLIRRKMHDQLDANAWRPLYLTKYFILFTLLLLALLGINWIGLFDPIALTIRSLSTAIFPALGTMTGSLYITQPHFHGAWIMTFIFLGILAMNLIYPRLWCRAFCPLGALLGLISRFPIFKITRQAALCTDCKMCSLDCQGADEPMGEHRVMECFVCLNCTEGCPEKAISYRPLPPLATSIPTKMPRRRFLRLSLFTLLIPFAVKASTGREKTPSKERIRPPGALPEEEFLDQCVRCGECMKVCPTNALHPAWGEAGPEGLWTPVLIPRAGYCEFNCNICSKVCPTGAIAPFTVKEKQKNPIVIGAAVIHRGSCLPWANDTPCTVCEEMCPTDPKAILLERVTVTTAKGERELLRPRVDLHRCIGCGICENKCPVVAAPAITIISSNESRDPSNRIVPASLKNHHGQLPIPSPPPRSPSPPAGEKPA